jgi:hypothetical protein
MPRDAKDYTVGYGKPPVATRFKKGQSGNPSGRPKGRRALAALLKRALEAKVAVTDRGRRTRKSKLEILLTQLVNKAAGGDLRAIQQVTGMMPLLDPANADVLGRPDAAADREIAEGIFARWAKVVLADPSEASRSEVHHVAD